jgi:predicted RNase H-like HicB family nuclease
MAKYVYPAIFTSENVGYSVRFPDVPGCYTEGDTIAEAIEMAKDALNLTLYGAEEDGDVINPPSDIRSIKVNDNEFVSLIACDTIEYRRYFDNKAVKKTLTIPNWLNVMSEKANVNFSAVLQEALIEKLNINH